MKTRAGIALLLAGVLGSSAGPIGSANAQDPIADTVCQAGQDAAISRMFTAILKSRGVPEWAIDTGDGSYSAWKEFLSTRDGERVNATAMSITKSALSAMVPGAGAAITGSELSIAGVEATIGEAEALRAKAFLCNGTSAFGDRGLDSFFNYPRVQEIAPGVNCENFADRVTTYSQLTQLKEFWEGYYSAQAKVGMGTSELVRDTLGQAWFTLQQQWAHRWAQTEMHRIRDELVRTANSPAAAQCAAPTQQAQGAPSDRLGTEWAESESGWSGLWVRRGTSNTFDASWGGGSIRAVLTISISGNRVSVSRVNATDGNNCQYEGELSGSYVAGTYRCTSGGGEWRASIR